MTLKSLFAIPIAVFLIVTLSLAGMLAGQSWSGLARGRAAVAAVEHMRLLLQLQSELRAERIMSNYALGKPYPMPDPVKQQLVVARRNTDRGIEAVAAMVSADVPGRGKENPSWSYIEIAVVRLAAIRDAIDALLVSGQGARSFAQMSTVMPRLFAVSDLLDEPLERASLAVTAADEGLSGLVTEDRLAESLRDQVGLIAALLLPKFNTGAQPSAGDMEQLRILLAETLYLTRLLGASVEIAGPTAEVRSAVTALKAIDVASIPAKLNDQAWREEEHRDDGSSLSPVQSLLVPWGEQINAVRTAIVDAAVARAAERNFERERQFDLSITAFGIVIFAALESVVLLSQRVVGPLAQLGMAITRIAAGDRRVALHLPAGTREISEMVTAVETLRQAALVADAAAMRHRMATQHRLEVLRKALAMAQSVREPAHALERGVARLSEGIDATIALLTSATTPPATPPATLGVAADAVRVGLAEMRYSAADLDATFAAADTAQTEDRPEAEFVAHIMAVRAEVDRWSEVVRGFVQASLVALRDAASIAGAAPDPALRDLIGDQFERVEETVAAIAAMVSAVTRATAVVRELPLHDIDLAA